MEMIGTLLLLLVQAPTVVSVTRDSARDFKEPQLAIEDDGHVYATYGEGNAIFASVSEDKGSTFSAPIKVGEAGKMPLGMRRGPRIVAYNGLVTITAVYGEKGGGADGDILTFRSTDHGQTWSRGGMVNDEVGAAREGLHAMAVAADGTLACSWLDCRAKGKILYMSTSKDGGTTWAKNRLVYQSPSGSICECCHPSLSYNKSGTLILMFRNSLNGARDMYLSSTSDNGNTFTPAMKMGKGTWMLSGCPMDGGMVSNGNTGAISTVWRRENTIYACRVGVEEVKLGDGKQPWGTFGPGGLYAIWSGPNSLVVATPKIRSFELPRQGVDPVMAASPDHKIVVAAWGDNGIQSTRLAP